MPLSTLIVLICHYQFRLVSPIQGYLFSPHIVTSVPSKKRASCLCLHVCKNLCFMMNVRVCIVLLGDFAAGPGAGNDENIESE